MPLNNDGRFLVASFAVAKALAVDSLVPVAVPGRPAFEVFWEVGRKFLARDGGMETVGLDGAVFAEEMESSPWDRVRVRRSGSSSGQTFR